MGSFGGFSSSFSTRNSWHTDDVHQKKTFPRWWALILAGEFSLSLPLVSSSETWGKSTAHLDLRENWGLGWEYFLFFFQSTELPVLNTYSKPKKKEKNPFSCLLEVACARQMRISQVICLFWQRHCLGDQTGFPSLPFLGLWCLSFLWRQWVFSIDKDGCFCASINPQGW